MIHTVMTRLAGIRMFSFLSLGILLTIVSKSIKGQDGGGGSVRLMRRTLPTFALSTPMVLATTTLQVIVVAALRPLSVPAKVQNL